MASIEDIENACRANPGDVRFSDLERLCEHHFGKGRQNRTSHRIFKTPWVGDPRINIQEGRNGRAKSYQVKQVLKAIDKLKRMDCDGEDFDEREVKHG
ncbi:toxin HicA [Gallaecimonas kandeliae]|uniref:toxin HicA n=1 Tax=Gallaecimonas kandeliae TaxID=3029055 RepID=UPI002649A6AA|nr:toxin HicA [Gallaecimonas kandeliae]WKE67260.1 toxin HicA [Gallaecimonas kandeliae]